MKQSKSKINAISNKSLEIENIESLLDLSSATEARALENEYSRIEALEAKLADYRDNYLSLSKANVRAMAAINAEIDVRVRQINQDLKTAKYFN